MEEVFAAKVK